jgi:hypothetical protein
LDSYLSDLTVASDFLPFELLLGSASEHGRQMWAADPAPPLGLFLRAACLGHQDATRHSRRN